MDIIIDEDFKKLLPALDKETFTWLEGNMLAYGCQNPLALWEGILIDGHNRWEIIKKHGLEYNTISMDFDSRDDVIIWIISTQVSRRNLNPLQLSHFRGLHYNTDKRMRGNASGRNQHSEEMSQIGTFPQAESTASRLADKYGVSRNTIQRDAQVSSAICAIGEISHYARQKILSGEINISRRRLQELASGDEKEIAETAAQIKAGTYELRHSGEAVSKYGSAKTSVQNNASPPWMAELSSIAQNFNMGLKSMVSIEDPEIVKNSIRSLIDLLNDLYEKIL